MQEGREVVSEIGWREALPAARDVVDAPPAMGSDGRGLGRLEAVRVDLVRMDPDQEESFEVSLNLPPPGELDVASPHMGRYRRDVDRESGFLPNLAHQRLLVCLARLERTARSKPPGLTVGQIASKEQEALFRVDDERAGRGTDGWTRPRAHGAGVSEMPNASAS